MLSAVSLLIICSVGYIIIRHLSNQPQVINQILSLQLIISQRLVGLNRHEAFLRLPFRGQMLQRQLKAIN